MGHQPRIGSVEGSPSADVHHVDDQHDDLPVGVRGQADEIGDGVYRIELNGVKGDGFPAELHADQQRSKPVEGVETPFGERREQWGSWRKRDG